VADFEQALKDRMKRLGVDIIQLVECLPRRLGAEIIGKQIIRCATSIGANYRAACRARSKADFIAKIAIAEEESDETLYWLEVLQDLKLVDAQSFDRLHGEAEEITKILVSSGRTAKQNSTAR
jgi:four helix bundle protein